VSYKRQLLIYFAAAFWLAAGIGVHESIFNNFLFDTFEITATARGLLEFPRELPGLLVVLTTGILARLAVTHVGVVGTLVFAAGMIGMAAVGGRYGAMVVMMIVGSTGMHMTMPVGTAVVLALTDENKRGTRIGQAGAIGTIGTILGTGFIWLFFDRADPQYRLGFLYAAGGGLLAAAMYALMYIPHLHQPRARLVVRKKFGLYYLLSFLFGARKQIFITFGPWVLIRVYGESASGIAALLMTASIIGIAFKPLAGMAIDRFGERTVMIVDGIALAAVCLGYGYASGLTDDPATAHFLACTCFVCDNLLFALGTSRAVYVSRLTESHDEITSTLAMGVSINHIASMTIPAVAGMVWISLGYERVFLAAAILALVISAVSTFVPRHNRS